MDKEGMEGEEMDKEGIEEEMDKEEMEGEEMDKERIEEEEKGGEIYLGGIKKNEQQYISSGVYGCVWKPGITNKGSKYKKDYVTKIHEINYNAKNEIKIAEYIKKINNYKKRFLVVDKYSIINFNKIYKSKLDTRKCEDLFEKEHLYLDRYNKLVNKKFFLLYSKYVNGPTLNSFFHKQMNEKDFIITYINTFYYIINSIKLLVENNIVHNDLHTDNILYDLNNNTPIIIDYGLSYNTNYFIKQKNKINYNIFLEHFFSFRDYKKNSKSAPEKRFESFCRYLIEYIYEKEIDNNDLNNLTNENINFFINDCIQSINYHQFLNIIFDEKELEYYKKKCISFYTQFLDKNKYYYYSDIISYLLPYINKYNDIYGISISYLKILLDYSLINEQHSNYYQYGKTNHNKFLIKYYFIKKIIIQLIKHILNPDPLERLTIQQFVNTFNFIFEFMYNEKQYNDNTYNSFNENLISFFNEQNINTNLFSNTEYGYIDFNEILTKENLIVYHNLFK